MKYRHRGYRDSDRDEREQQRKAPARDPLTKEERIQQRSLRKATNREANEVVRCGTCGRNVEDAGMITSTSSCPHCHAPLHCCRGSLPCKSNSGVRQPGSSER